MTIRASARVTGIALLLYIAFGISSMVVGRGIGGDGIEAQIASTARHESTVRARVVLNLLCTFCAVTLGVSLWSITRQQDADLATLGMAFRVGEGIIGAVATQGSMGLLWLATATGAGAPSAEGARTLGSFLLYGQGGGFGAIFFSVGSAAFSWLLLRGRLIPTALAWLGVVASIAMVIGQPLQLLGVVPDSATWFMWIPMAAFEIPLGLVLLFRGVRPPA